MKTIEISYNPYKMITRILIDKVDVCKNDSYDKFKEFIQNKIPLQTWIEPFPILIGKVSSMKPLIQKSMMKLQLFFLAEK